MRLNEAPIQTGFVYDARCASYRNPSMIIEEDMRHLLDLPHCEAPERISYTHSLLAKLGVLEHLNCLEAREATEDDWALVHTSEHIRRMRDACAIADGSSLGPHVWATDGLWEAARLSTGGLLSAIDAVAEGRVANAFVLLRPPGHHATADQAMGYCLFNSIAVGARYAQQHHGLRRVAIIDWDVHHGNGTQALFDSDPTVLFISVHQDNLFPPNSGSFSESGSGPGLSYTVNIPLPAGSTDVTYSITFDRLVMPIVREFSPDILLVSAGQDPSAFDIGGRMSLTASGFRQLATYVRQLAEEKCQGRLVVYQEGGYSIPYIPFCNLGIVEALGGLDPSLPVDRDALGLEPASTLRVAEETALERIASHYHRWWPVGMSSDYDGTTG